MKKIMLIAIASVLVGCSSTPTIEMSTPSSVVIKNASPKKTVENLQLAETECVKYGKHAVATSSNKKDKTASFECKE